MATYMWIKAEDAKVNTIYQHCKYLNEDGVIMTKTSPAIIYKGNGKGISFWYFHDDFDEVIKQEPDVENIVEVEVELFGREADEYNKAGFDISENMCNLLGLYNDVYSVEGPQELDNTWASYDFYEIARDLKNAPFYIWGVAPAPYSGGLSGKPTAFVLEDHLTGERFWLHTKDDWVIKMRNQMAWAYNQLVGCHWEVEDNE